MAKPETVIIGGGVIGLACAFVLALDDNAVTVVDPFVGRGASYVAAGMIAPLTEATYGEEPLVGLTIAAAGAWPAFSELLGRHTPLHPGYERAGTLVVAADNNDHAALRAQLPFYERLGLAALSRTASELRSEEPLLSPSVRGGYFAPHDVQVDNRRLVSALFDAAARNGVGIRPERVRSLRVSGDVVSGVETERGMIAADRVVVATGHDLDWLSDQANDVPRIRPVKGQILRLHQHEPSLRLRRTVRGLVNGSPIYLVPRSTGQVVVGATVEEQGRSLAPTADACYRLLRDATALVPSIAEAEFLGLDVGLRPATANNMPLVGASNCAGLYYALGHYRHGVLLAPISANAIAELLRTGRLPEVMMPFSPRPNGPGA